MTTRNYSAAAAAEAKSEGKKKKGRVRLCDNLIVWRFFRGGSIFFVERADTWGLRGGQQGGRFLACSSKI